MTTTRPLRAAILARYWGKPQHERSNEDQVSECRAAAARMGFVVLEEWVCTDGAKSGATVHDRVGFQRLVAAARLTSPPFDVILVDDYSRLSREHDVAIGLLRDLTARRIRIVGASDGFDSCSRGAMLAVMLRGAATEIYLDDVAKNTHSGQRGIPGPTKGGLR